MNLFKYLNILRELFRCEKNFLKSFGFSQKFFNVC